MDETATPARTRVAAVMAEDAAATDRFARRRPAEAGAVAIPGRRRAAAAGSTRRPITVG